MTSDVLPISALDPSALPTLFTPFGLKLELVPDGAEISGSYWGAPEAGLIGDRLYLRPDTPVHSALHEGAHFICMDADRRARLHTDAGGADVEEHAVCYLQCLIADRLDGYSRERCFADMDLWGYTFVLGSAAAWFERDSEDARAWLRERGLMFS
jgi:hypothetical protein